MSEKAQLQAEIDLLVASHTLHGSESLCKLLRYLGKQAVEHPGIPVKEYQIATEVFGRQADFDPQLDSMVRVQAGRLRAKLGEYYSTEGSADRLIVELPKGSYAIAFHERSNHLASSGNGAAAAHATISQDAQAPARTDFTTLLLSFALLAAVATIGWLLWTRHEPSVASAGLPALAPVAAPIETFWRGFVRGPEEPWVIFSNAQFVGRPDKGMRYYDAARDGKTPILDHYTGVGEVLAVHNLDLVFGALRQSLRIKRGSLFSLDDAKNNDLIFIGSPGENLTLLDIPSTREFTFQRKQEGARAGNMEIVNVKPGAGEAASYMASPSNVPMSEDYAVVALVKAINPEHYELILAGTTTIGTQAAVEYVTRENYLNELLTKMNVTRPAELKPFEAVIQVKVAKGVPVESSLVAIRILN
ncbi:MAG TPA: hypothetical protein VN749_19925 [Candidatus Eisenbacteria bacterium]|nr:hypothetical protein [Candidatus Eisenbacteria bacterium]